MSAADASTVAAAPPPTAKRRRDRLRRDPGRGVLGGVCAGLAEALGVPAFVLRLVCLGLVPVGGIGVFAYVVVWVFLPADTSRPARRSRRAGLQISAGTVLLVLAVLLSLRELGWWFSDAIVWPLLLAVAGGSLLWRPAGRDADGVIARRDDAEPAASPASQPAVGRRIAVYRGGFGVALVLGAALLFLGYLGVLGPLRDVVLGVVVVTLALSLILAPFLWRLGRNLAAERAARIRSQERAEVAAHLHDSVLQTLALMQKRADDPRTVAALARRQERELRTWLWEARAPSAAESLAAALRAAAAELEDDHGVTIEVVAVGDAPIDDGTRALAAAAREALNNAAKFAGDAGPIDLYAEVEPGRASVYVRDRGSGFSLEGIPADRRGVRDSILGRMERHGGQASIHPAPGGGTEVQLTLDLRVT